MKVKIKILWRVKSGTVEDVLSCVCYRQKRQCPQIPNKNKNSRPSCVNREKRLGQRGGVRCEEGEEERNDGQGDERVLRKVQSVSDLVEMGNVRMGGD
ncbi:hypothetical protein E2C01_046395 [Portunus trituberculatus]|uniref:Uncharacterized protein n=1 Tax=Portunus trituberculatus TaxID=210409 RepID=A0A5B7G7N0_PORTR|nr:hypothetical protein [Portunus trituberculatus]